MGATVVYGAIPSVIGDATTIRVDSTGALVIATAAGVEKFGVDTENGVVRAGDHLLVGNIVPIGTWGGDGVSNGTATITDVGGAAHGLSLAAGDLVHIQDSTTPGDEGFYRIISDDGTNVVLNSPLVGSHTDLRVAFYRDVIAFMETNGTNGQLIQGYSHQDKPLQIGGDELTGTGHSLGAEDVLIGGLLEVDGIAYFDGTVGIGIAPAADRILHVLTSDTGTKPLLELENDQANSNADVAIFFNAAQNTIDWSMGIDASDGSFLINDQSTIGAIVLALSDTTRNMGLGTKTWGTSAARVFAITNGTAPTTSPADEIQIWSDDVSSKASLHILPEDGAILTVSGTGGFLGQSMGIASVTSVEDVSSSGNTHTISNFLPVGMILGVVIHNTTAVEGATTYQVGDGTDVDRWGDAIGLSADTSPADFTIASVPYYTSVTDVVLTAVGGAADFSAGILEVTVYYMTLSPSTT